MYKCIHIEVKFVEYFCNFNFCLSKLFIAKPKSWLPLFSKRFILFGLK